MINRCVNIDWLEVFCSEPITQPLNADYFISKGYYVKQRDYGTPQYREMFTVYEHNFPFIEVRRNPYSLKPLGGIFNANDCHIRLCNRACYSLSPINDLRKFLLAHRYTYKSLTRIDICLDFNRFDKGTNPEIMMRDYMEGRISKINQCNIAAHGKDSFARRIWNSVSWGSSKSPISTKLYCKSLELKEVKDKFYIRDAWAAAGLDVSQPVWRVEFSVKSDYKHFVKLDTGELVPNDLTTYDDRHKCLFRFHSFAAKYFHFKIVERKKDGTLQRKDRCKDKILFVITKDESSYIPVKLTEDTEPDRTDKLLADRLRQMLNDVHTPANVKKACQIIMVELLQKHRMVKLDSYAYAMVLRTEK